MKNKTSVLLVALIFFFVSCSNENPVSADSKSFPEARNAAASHLFKGPQVQVGNGKARSWVLLSSDGYPMEIGVELTPAAMEGLSADHQLFTLPLHQKTKEVTPFDHIGLNWNPNGHQPPGVFDIPHFDLHLYMISIAQQLAIPEWSPETDAQFSNYPPAGYMPDTYFTPPGVGTSEMQMGKHWLPVNLGDFLPFSKIMILGSYDGAFTFIEPMVTRDYLMTGADFSASYPQPLHFAQAGNYPTRYNIYRNPDTGNIYVTLSSFMPREQAL